MNKYIIDFSGKSEMTKAVKSSVKIMLSQREGLLFIITYWSRRLTKYANKELKKARTIRGKVGVS